PDSISLRRHNRPRARTRVCRLSPPPPRCRQCPPVGSAAAPSLPEKCQGRLPLTRAWSLASASSREASARSSASQFWASAPAPRSLRTARPQPTPQVAGQRTAIDDRLSKHSNLAWVHPFRDFLWLPILSVAALLSR